MDSAEQNDWVSFCERGWFPLLHYHFGQNPQKRREQLSSFSSSKLGAGIGLSSQVGATHVDLFSNICSHFSIHVFVPPNIFTEVSLYEPVRMDSAEQNDWVSFCERGWFPLLHYHFGQNPQKRREQLSSFSSSKLGAGIGLSSQAVARQVFSLK